MAYEGVDHSWIKRIGGGILALVVAAVVGALVRGRTSEAITHANTSPSAIERQIESLATDSPEMSRFYADLKLYFPSEYAEFLNTISREARAGADKSDIRRVAFKFMRSLTSKQGPNVAHASNESIRALIEAETAVAEQLAQESPSLCAKFTMEGLDASDHPSNVAMELITKGAQVRLAAAASGQRDPISIEDPTEGDWAQLILNMEAAGVSEQQINHLLNSTYGRLPLDQQCAMGLRLYRALRDSSDGSELRIYRSIAGAA